MKKHRLMLSMIGAYLTFLGTSLLIVTVLVPQLLKRSLLEISEDANYRGYLRSQAGAIQNTCYLMISIVFVLSLFPVMFWQIKVYRPLNRICEAAARYLDGDAYSQLLYDKDDELGRLTTVLNYLLESADNLETYQRKFISNISHDFRSPLTSIKGYVEAMLDGTIPPQMQERYLRIVLSETERLNKLTEGLLLLNSFDDKGVYLELTDFDLIEVIRHTVDAFEVLCQKKDLTIRTDFPSHPVFVHADMGRIQQVLYNLIDNAIKFSYPGRDILLSIHERKKLVFVSVKDFGEGISKENLSKIWERFFKTDASRGRDKKGTGLGLSIVKEIIRAHNQNINVVSTEGIGTEFVFTLAAAGKDAGMKREAEERME